MQRNYTLEELARFLNRQPKELKKLAENDVLHGYKVQGNWTFALPDLVFWMEQEMTQDDKADTSKLEEAVTSVADVNEDVAFQDLISPGSVKLPFTAKTRSSVISDIAKFAEDAGLLWDANVMAQALREREEMASTAMDNGVAILHPRRPMPELIAQDFLVVAVTPSGVPFGGGSVLTNVFFLLCCQSDVSYLRSLGKLARVLKVPGLLSELCDAASPEEVVDLLVNTANELE